MKRIIVMVVALLMVSIILNGCGKKETSEIMTDVVIDKQTENNINDISEKSGTNINTSIGQTGSDLKLPESFPKDIVPLMDDANIVNVDEDKASKSTRVIFKTEKNFSEAAAFYKDVMKNGTIDMDLNQETSYLLMGKKANYNVMITISKYDGEKISVLVNVTPIF